METVKIKERIVVNMPRCIQEATVRKRNVWVRRAILRSVWEIRNKHLCDGYDIFGVYIMPDCIEINVNGELEPIKVQDNKLYSARDLFRQRKKKKAEEDDD